jgi:hypothetical protein
MPIQVRGVLVHAMSGTELSRVRTEFRLRLPEPINNSPLESREADIVMQSRGYQPGICAVSSDGIGQQSSYSVTLKEPCQFYAARQIRVSSKFSTLSHLSTVLSRAAEVPESGVPPVVRR